MILLRSLHPLSSFFCFFFNDPATTHIYTLSLHDALPIFLDGHIWLSRKLAHENHYPAIDVLESVSRLMSTVDRKSTRLNSSHEWISYAVFCLKKKKTKTDNATFKQSIRCEPYVQYE